MKKSWEEDDNEGFIGVAVFMQPQSCPFTGFSVTLAFLKLLFERVFLLLCYGRQVTKEKVMALLQAADVTAQLQAFKSK